MKSSLLLGVWVFHQLDYWVLDEFLDFGDLNEVIYSLALVFEVETRVLEGSWHFGNRLADIVDSFLGRYLYS